MTTSPARPIVLRAAIDAVVAPAEVVAASRALLERPPAGDVVRLFRTRACVAFGPKDERASGYSRAVEAAQAAGFEPVPRLEGGRAVATGPATLGIAWTVPGGDGRARIRPRFSMLAAIVAEALRELGVAAEVGPVAGEYCPGDFSVGVGGRVKVAGLGQRVTAGGSHLGAFVVVDDAVQLREVLAPVNEALGVAWEPRSLGSVADLVGPGVGLEAVARAVEGAFGRRFPLVAAHAEPPRPGREGHDDR